MCGVAASRLLFREIDGFFRSVKNFNKRLFGEIVRILCTGVIQHSMGYVHKMKYWIYIAADFQIAHLIESEAVSEGKAAAVHFYIQVTKRAKDMQHGAFAGYHSLLILQPLIECLPERQWMGS